MKWWWLLVFLFVVSLLLGIYGANAHDSYTGLRNGYGIQCCGGKDCAPYDGPVRQVRGGWIVNGEFVADDKTLPSFDVNYHRCYWGDETKCFLIPGSS